jgi:RNA polymerase sigma-70 factor, ECF subfamily
MGVSLDPSQEELASLLQAASRGDPQAWRELVSRYSRRVYALAKSRCRNDDVAEEIAQSVFATVAVKLRAGEYTESGRFEPWLFRVAMNRVRDAIRKARRNPETHDESAFIHTAHREPDEPAFDAAAIGRLRSAMTELSDADREIIELRHHGGLSFKQIADILEEPVGTLLARHHRALKKLKEALDSASEGLPENVPNREDRE